MRQLDLKDRRLHASIRSCHRQSGGNTSDACRDTGNRQNRWRAHHHRSSTARASPKAPRFFDGKNEKQPSGESEPASASVVLRADRLRRVLDDRQLGCRATALTRPSVRSVHRDAPHDDSSPRVIRSSISRDRCCSPRAGCRRTPAWRRDDRRPPAVAKNNTRDDHLVLRADAEDIRAMSRAFRADETPIASCIGNRRRVTLEILNAFAEDEVLRP